MLLTRAASNAAADVASAFDFDRNGRVDIRDVAVARSHVGQVLGMPAQAVAVAAAEAPADTRGGYRPPADGLLDERRDDGVWI